MLGAENKLQNQEDPYLAFRSLVGIAVPDIPTRNAVCGGLKMATNSLLFILPMCEVSLLTPLIRDGLMAPLTHRMWQNVMLGWFKARS